MNKKTKFLIVAGSVVFAIVVLAVWAYPACISATIKHYPVMFVIGLLVCLGVGGFGAVLGLQQMRGYGAALIATSTILPAAATLTTVLIFLGSGEETSAPFWGSGIALLAWAILAVFCLRFTDAKHAIPSSYGELCQRLAQLRSQLNVICPDIGFPSDPRKNIAFKQAKIQIEEICDEFSQRGLHWALARGYINVWNRLHRAEEAIIEIAPQETVIAGALNDILRLQGSKIDHDDELIARLRQAIDDIDPSARKYLQGAATALPLVITTPSPLVNGYESIPYLQTLAATGGTPPINWSLSQGSSLPERLELSAGGVLSGTPNSTRDDPHSFIVRVNDSAKMTDTKAFTLKINSQSEYSQPTPADAVTTETSIPDGLSDSKAQARTVLRDVRCAINEFRDERWNGLIVLRNRLIATMMFTGLTAYVLLAIAIIMGANQPAIAGASTFYLVGATIGLLNQLRSVSQSETAVEDYGLSTARLITMPLICGLAAIGGVVLMAMLPPTGLYAENSSPLAITTPSKLAVGVFDKLYYQRIDAAGGTPPYSWSASNGPLPEGMELKATGDLIAKLPKKPESTKRPESIKFTAQVKDNTGSSVEKAFFLNMTSASTSVENQLPSKVTTATSTTPIRSLENIFDLHNNIIGLLLALVFGLTPGLLFERLQQQAEKYKADLKGSEVTQVKPKS